jgi:shikimate kinase
VSNGKFRENLVLVGFMASGKSSIGRLLARKLRRRFADTDRLVTEREQRDIPEIFTTEGEPYFRQAETAALESLVDSDQLVIATGGGIVTQGRNLVILQRLGFVIWLCADEEVTMERVSRNQNRPLLQTADPRATIRELYEKRRPLYEQAAQFAVNTSTLPHNDVADAIIAEANRRFSCKAEA